MNKARRAAPSRAKLGGGRRRQQYWLPLGLVLLLIFGVVIGLIVYLTGRSAAPAERSVSQAPRSAPAAILIGQNAPAFTLPDAVSGKTYSFAPGDGKNHLLVFYMGNF